MANSLNKMFATLPLPTANADPEEALRVYYETCQGYSNDDVDLAVRQFLSGTVVGHNAAFAPTAAQFAKQLRANLEYQSSQTQKRNMLLEQFREQELDEQWQAKRTPEQRAKVKAMLESFQKGREEKTPEDIEQEREWLSRHDQFYAEQFMETASGTPVSKYLARQLGSAYDPEDDEGDMGGMK